MADFSIRKQNYKFDSKTTPKYWYSNNPVLTSLWNSLSLTFPDGEKFFVRAVRHYNGAILDPNLLEDIKIFTGQEAAHGKEHRALNKMLYEQGYENVEDLEKQVKALLEFANRNLPMPVQLAATCALEHFTAILAEQLILDKNHRDLIHESMRDLWLWHAVEESEHKHVAFEVYEKSVGSYWLRVLVMLAVSIILVAVISKLQFELLKLDGNLFNKGSWAETIKYLYSDPGLFTNLVVPYSEYFNPKFHPNKKDTYDLISERNKILKSIS